MNDATSTITAIKGIVARLKRDPALAGRLQDDADLVEGVGMDSLEMLQFMLELEERLAIQIDFDQLEFAYLRSIARLAGFLDSMPRRQLAAGAA
jgi:acyl carrier protein